MFLKICSACGALLVFLVAAARSGLPPVTNVLYGFISSNRTLTYASPGPTYDVIGDVVVNPGVTLTVEPGVTLRCASGRDTLQGGDYPSLCEFDVFGTLLAQGQAGDSIYFRSTGGGAGDWGQIKVEDGANLMLRYASLSGPQVGVNLKGNGSRQLDAVSVLAYEGISSAGGPVTIQRCHLSGVAGAGDGLYLGTSFASTAPPDSHSVEPTEIDHFQYGVFAQVGGTSLTNLVVHDCNHGVWAYSSGPMSLNYITAVHNVEAVRICGSPATVFNSIAGLNSFYGFVADCGFGNYLDSWQSGTNYPSGFPGPSYGPSCASFNPFFVDPANNNFRLATGSVFKTYSSTGNEIGAYGPGPGLPTASGKTTWGRLKSLYR